MKELTLGYFFCLEPTVHFKDTTLKIEQSARGQGAVVLPAPRSVWIYRVGDKFSCRTVVSYPTPFNNPQIISWITHEKTHPRLKRTKNTRLKTTIS